MGEVDAIAVIVSMRADASADLARAALESTWTGLRAKDSIFLMIDGGDSIKDQALCDLCARNQIRVYYSRHRRGLAASLNDLIDRVLEDKRFAYFARMDADDQSLPDRFEKQREFFRRNPGVDILGGLCHELNERGEHLRTKKMPLAHQDIVATLPHRNALNHPTIMMNRKVFESGLRYRVDVGMVEDWCLWIDAASAGFRFANLDDVVLTFRRDCDFFQKRGGWKQACSEYRMRRHAMRSFNRSSVGALAYAFTASSMRLCPAFIQRLAYQIVG